jgi:hypothetical protein
MKHLIIILCLSLIIYFLLNYFKSTRTVDVIKEDNIEYNTDELYHEFFNNDEILNNVINENKNKNENENKNITPHIQKDYAGFTHEDKNFNNNLEHFDSADLLPKLDGENKINDNGWTIKNNNGWDESNPQIKQVEGNAWLNERKFLGISTVGSSLRNATHDIRRDIPNPQMVVSPWNNTTMVPDTNNKGLCTL